MATRNVVQRAFDTFGKEAGFIKRSGSWYETSSEVISITNLQKSSYDASYYINQSFSLRPLCADTAPRVHSAHIRHRLDFMVPAEADNIRRLLDLELGMPEQERFDSLLELLRASLLPLIRRGRTLAGLREMLIEGVFKYAAVTAAAEEALLASR